jgi:hypothetical protein
VRSLCASYERVVAPERGDAIAWRAPRPVALDARS